MAQAPIIFDRLLLRARSARATALGPVTFLIDRVAEELVERLGAVLRRFELAADIGTPTDTVRRALMTQQDSGKVGAMGAQSLGSFAAGEARTYKFTVEFPDGGVPASATTGDNAYKGSSMSVGYQWDAAS